MRSRVTQLVALIALPAILVMQLPRALAGSQDSSEREQGGPPRYEKRDSLQATLNATRHQYRVWCAEQPVVRQQVTWGPWYATPLLPADSADEQLASRDELDVTARRADGAPLWSQRDDLPAEQPVSLLSGAAGQVLYLACVARVAQPVTLTVGVGGGEQLDAWLNGRAIASVPTRLVYGRYGCSDGYEGTRVDQVLLDLELHPGENTLKLRLMAGGEPSFWFSSTPALVPAFWARLREDFPPADNPLLDLVPANWFDTTGWFAAEGTEFEEQLLPGLIAACGADGATAGTAFDQLKQSGVAGDDIRWLDLCVQCAALARIHDEVDRLRAAVEALGDAHASQYPIAELRDRLADYERRVACQARGQLDPATEATRGLLAELPRMRREMLVDLHPLLRGAEIVFVKRYTYNSKHYYDDFQHISAWGGNLCVLSLADGSVWELVPQLAGGVFDRYDVSFDARRIVFGYRRPQREGFRLYELDIDSGALRQVTAPPPDEEQRIARYGRTSFGDGFYGLLGYQFWTDDVHPCYLPDGGISFASTRSEHGVLCTPAHYLACTNLYRLDAGGSGLRQLSYGALSEFSPTLMEDGRILYNRWEYVYKGIAAAQPLWTMRPDGSGSEEYYGDNVTDPGVLWQARQVPGNPRLAVCIGCGHEPLGVGQVLLLDLNKNKRTPAPITNLTPDVKIQNLRGIFHLRNGVWREDFYGPLYADPYPLSDKFFLVSCNPAGRYNDPAGYGLALLDVFGNRVPIYEDPEIACWQPMLLQPRPVPPVFPPVPSPTTTSPAIASVFLSDVYRGLEDVPRGTVRYLRVLEQVAKPWSAEVDTARGEDRAADGFGGHLAVTWNAHIWIAVLHGIVPVAADGSAHFQVPANRNLFFQALDEDYMEVQRMRTFVNFMPGESRSCIGCHEHRTQAPDPRNVTASMQAPLALSAQPGDHAPRPLYYPTDVQPILDRHCVHCHNGSAATSTHEAPAAAPQTEAEVIPAAPDLRGELTELFSRSYESLMQGQWINTIQEWNGSDWAMRHAETVPPYTYGAHRSRLVELLRDGHFGVQLEREEFIRLVTWIDTGGQYYGSYFGRRHLRYRGQPDFRPVPTLSSACGVAPPEIEIPLCEPLPARLLACWPLDGATPDSARQFDGTQYLACDGLGTHAAVSIALRAKADTLGHTWNPLLFGNDMPGGVVHFSLLADGRPNVAVHTADQNWTHRTARASVAVGQWHHLVLVCDARMGGLVRFYVDGQRINEDRMNLGIQLNMDAFRIGGWNQWEAAPGNNFHGALRDVRIYSGMLTDQQAAQLAAGQPVEQ